MILYYYLSAILLTLGLIGLLIKKDLVSMLLSIEVILASISIFYGLFSKAVGNSSLDPQLQVLFIIIIAAAEAGVGLTLVIQLMKKNNSVYVIDIVENSES
ncbi:MAG: NADH-quinone oxidoreductase subunit NuoK [Bacteriovoracaceae bacterium]